MDIWIRRAFVAGTSTSLGLLMSVAVWAQDQPAAQQSQPAAQQQSQAAAENATQAQRTIQMVQVQAQLDKTLDTKKAKQGDPVTAKLQQNVQIPDAQALPKNTVLEGHVDQVEPSQNKSDATVTVTFDKAKLKDGKEVPIKATVLAVSEPVYAQQAGGGSPGGAPAAMPSSAPSGGGSMGGSSGSAPAPATPQPMNVPDASQGPSQPTQSHGGVPDVMLKSDIHEQSSVTFSSKGKNVHVPDGTQMQFALAVIPAGVTAR
jgi:hypothetical protein